MSMPRMVRILQGGKCYAGKRKLVLLTCQCIWSVKQAELVWNGTRSSSIQMHLNEIFPNLHDVSGQLQVTKIFPVISSFQTIFFLSCSIQCSVNNINNSTIEFYLQLKLDSLSSQVFHGQVTCIGEGVSFFPINPLCFYSYLPTD